MHMFLQQQILSAMCTKISLILLVKSVQNEVCKSLLPTKANLPRKIISFAFPIYFPLLCCYHAYVTHWIHVRNVLGAFFWIIHPAISVQSKSKSKGMSFVDTDEEMSSPCWEGPEIVSLEQNQPTQTGALGKPGVQRKALL